jgi:hypothetical protein
MDQLRHSAAAGATGAASVTAFTLNRASEIRSMMVLPRRAGFARAVKRRPSVFVEVGEGSTAQDLRGDASHRDLQLMKTPGEDDTNKVAVRLHPNVVSTCCRPTRRVIVLCTHCRQSLLNSSRPESTRIEGIPTKKII